MIVINDTLCQYFGLLQLLLQVHNLSPHLYLLLICLLLGLVLPMTHWSRGVFSLARFVVVSGCKLTCQLKSRFLPRVLRIQVLRFC